MGHFENRKTRPRVYIRLWNPRCCPLRILWLCAALLPAAATLAQPEPVQFPEISSGATGAAPKTTAFTNVTVIPVDQPGILPGQTVIVRGDRIEALGPSAHVPVPGGAHVIDASGKFLAPGLVDTHVHLDPMVGARPGFGDAALFLAHGVTTVFNLRGDRQILDWRSRIQAGDILAPNLYTSGEFVNEPRVNTPGRASPSWPGRMRWGRPLSSPELPSTGSFSSCGSPA